MFDGRLNGSTAPLHHCNWLRVTPRPRVGRYMEVITELKFSLNKRNPEGVPIYIKLI